MGFFFSSCLAIFAISLPNYSSCSQWNNSFYLYNSGFEDCLEGEDINVLGAWNQNITGKGVRISIVDTGCDPNNVFISPNFNISSSFNIETGLPNVATSSTTRGTTLAFLAGGHPSSIGSIGVAPDSSISCIATIHHSKGYSLNFDTDRNFTQAAKEITHKYSEVDIRVLSEGFSIFSNSSSKPILSLFSPQEEIDNAFEEVSKNGREGKGLITILAAGDSGELGEMTDSFVQGSSRFPIIVGGSSCRGAQLSLSDFSSSILVNAPTGGSESALSESRSIPVPSGSLFNLNGLGTSAAASIVAGVVALMLEANNNLTWRDVQSILILTSSKNDPSNPLWKTNSQGFAFNPYLGFGRIDAAAAVNLSKNWSRLPEEQQTEATSNSTIQIPHYYMSEAIVSFNVSSDINFTEYVQVSLKVLKIDGLRIKLVSPSGTSALLMHPHVSFPPGLTLYFNISSSPIRLGSRAFYGERASGIWKLKFRHTSYFPYDYASNISIRIFGTQTSVPITDRRKSKVSTLQYNETSLRLKFGPYSGFARCGGNTIINLQSFPKPSGSPQVVFELFSPKNGRTLPLDKRNLEPDLDYEIYVPCSFENGSELYFGAHWSGGLSWSARFSYINPEKPQIASPLPYTNEYVRSDKETTHKVSYVSVRKANFAPCYESTIILTIYDYDENANTFAYSPKLDAGFVSFTFQPYFLIPKALITIVHVNEDKEGDICKDFITPLSYIYPKSEAIDNFAVKLLINKCGVPGGMIIDDGRTPNSTQRYEMSSLLPPTALPKIDGTRLIIGSALVISAAIIAILLAAIFSSRDQKRLRLAGDASSLIVEKDGFERQIELKDRI